MFEIYHSFRAIVGQYTGAIHNVGFHEYEFLRCIDHIENGQPIYIDIDKILGSTDVKSILWVLQWDFSFGVGQFAKI